MAETHSSVDRLETRLDSVAARVDALYSLLEMRGIMASPEGQAGDAFFDELLPIEESPMAREGRTSWGRTRPVGRLHVGSGSGV